MNRILIILAIPLFLLIANSCVEDGLEDTPTAEMYYVDLLYALHHDDQTGAKEAARRFTGIISEFHVGNYPMRAESTNEGMRFHLSNAENNYLQVRASIEKNELEQAMIQLNRATSELEAARIPGYQDFYIARIHEFLGSWLEVSRTSREEDLTSREWRAINRQIKSAYARWRECQWIRPSPSVYYFSMEDAAEFAAAHGEVDRLMELLKESLTEEDNVLTKSYVDATDSAVWAFVRRFGSPEEGGMDISPPAEQPSR